MIKWTTAVPPIGTICLVKGIAHGDYGYTPDEEKTFRARVTEPIIEDGEEYPTVEVLECTPRYWNGFTPEKYLTGGEVDFIGT